MNTIGRRRSLGLLGGAVLGLPWLLEGCEKPPASCADGPGVDAAVRQARQALNYQDRSPDAERHCESCRQWVAPDQASQCGSCKVLSGPIHPLGTCNAFSKLA